MVGRGLDDRLVVLLLLGLEEIEPVVFVAVSLLFARSLIGGGFVFGFVVFVPLLLLSPVRMIGCSMMVCSLDERSSSLCDVVFWFFLVLLVKSRDCGQGDSLCVIVL